jgi:urease accessory protein UreE
VQLAGIIIGTATSILISFLNGAVTKVEYHLGARHWPYIVRAGVALVESSIVVESPLVSGLRRAAGFAVAWSAPELIKQRERRVS